MPLPAQRKDSCLQKFEGTPLIPIIRFTRRLREPGKALSGPRSTRGDLEAILLAVDLWRGHAAFAGCRGAESEPLPTFRKRIASDRPVRHSGEDPAGTRSGVFHLMIQRLLRERVGLVVHQDQTSITVYELLIAKGGLNTEGSRVAPTGDPQPDQVAEAKTARLFKINLATVSRLLARAHAKIACKVLRHIRCKVTTLEADR